MQTVTDNKIKLFITDMDGTFLDSHRQMPSQNIDAVAMLKNMGIQTVFCTGRPVSFVRDYVKKSGVCDIVIGCNGAEILNTATDENLYSIIMDNSPAKDIIDFCLATGVDICAYNTKSDVFFSETSTHVDVFKNYNEELTAAKSDVPLVPLINLEKNVERLLSEGVCKILLTANDEKDLTRIWDFLHDKKNIYAVSSMNNVIDIMATGVSKGGGVRKIAEIMNVPLSNVCAIGDNDNDIPMFKVAGISVCLANGVAEAKEWATFVTKKTNDAAGFAEAVQLALRH